MRNIDIVRNISVERELNYLFAHNGTNSSSVDHLSTKHQGNQDFSTSIRLNSGE